MVFDDASRLEVSEGDFSKPREQFSEVDAAAQSREPGLSTHDFNVTMKFWPQHQVSVDQAGYFLPSRDKSCCCLSEQRANR